MPKQLSARKNKRLILLLLSLQSLYQQQISMCFSDRPWLGKEIERKIHSTRVGLGRGMPGRKRAKQYRHQPVPLWQRFLERNQEPCLLGLTRMTLSQFSALIEVLSPFLSGKITGLGTKMAFEDKLILIFLWIYKYPDYATLSELFGVSPAVISNLIDGILPHLAEFFLQWIPNDINPEAESSSMSKKIVAVIDSTLHAIRRPSRNQHHYYNSHYERHGILTHLLVDFHGYIRAIQTNVMGRIHDSNAANHNKCFPHLLRDKFALGDPGFAGVSWVVAGLKTNQLKSPSHVEFDRISRSEQSIVEHVNGFIKTCKVLSKSHQFVHSREKHVACIIIVCGWFNWIKLHFGKFE
jgi:hypothetical protein